MSGFRTSTPDFINAQNISDDPTSPTVFEQDWPSYMREMQYLCLLDGVVICPTSSGYVKMDIYMNGKKTNPLARKMQCTEDGSAVVSASPCVWCYDCVETTDADGNTVYNNKLRVELLWVKAANPGSVVPSVNGVCINVLAAFSS